MIRDLSDLTIGDQRADGHQAAVARRQTGAQPEIAEQQLGGIVQQPRRCIAELLPDPRNALCLGRLVEGSIGPEAGGN